MTRRRALLLFAGMVAALFSTLAGPAAATAASTVPAATESDSFILVGTGGITWTDVSPEDTPNLWGMLRDGSSSSISVRSVFTNTCPIDAWLSLSAGNRAAEAGEGGGFRSKFDPCGPIPEVTDGVVPRWSEFRRTAESLDFGAVLGTLGTQVEESGACIQAVGPGAGLAAATTSGDVERYAPFDADELTGLVSACRLSLVDVGSLRDPDEVVEGEAADPSRIEGVRAIDERVGQVLAAAPSGSDVMVASMSDAGSQERLRMVVATGPHYGPGELYSQSTRQSRLIQSADLTVTALAAVGADVPNELGGAQLRREPEDGNSEEAALERLETHTDSDLASYHGHELVPPFFNVFVIGQIVIYAFAAVVWKRRWGSMRHRTVLLRTTRVVSVAAAAVPVSTFLANLVPWWRLGSPMLGVIGAVGFFVVLITLVALAGPWGRRLLGPLAVVAATTAVVLAVDVITGSRLQLYSMMGLQPVTGGRFYGMGNVTFSIFATCAILLAMALADPLIRSGHRRRAAAVIGAIGVVAIVADGHPSWGADGGGPPAMIPAFAFLALAALGIRMTWRRALVIGTATVAAFLLVSFGDWLRPVQDRSHLGRFMQTLLDGGALQVIGRKLSANLGILTGNWQLTLLVPLALIFVMYVLARPTSWGSRALQRSFDRAPILRPGLISLLILLTIGFAVNDSGVAIPAAPRPPRSPPRRTRRHTVRSGCGSPG